MCDRGVKGWGNGIGDIGILIAPDKLERYRKEESGKRK